MIPDWPWLFWVLAAVGVIVALYVVAFAFGPGVALRWRRFKAGRR